MTRARRSVGGRARREAGTPPDRPVAAGTRVGGFLLEQVLRTTPTGWTTTSACDPDRPERRATLWISPVGAADDTALRELFDRVDAVRRLCDRSGPPLIAPLAAGADGTRLFLARQPLSTTTLADRLADGPLSARDTATLADTTARAIDVLHAFGLPHAPLTPDRIVLVGGDVAQARLYDFGLPCHPARACADPALLAAADHLAPEVARGGPLTVAADVYALGSILLTCLSGTPPFPYARPVLVLHAHATERPRHVAPTAGTPAHVDTVLAKALNKIPEHRQRTATGLALAFSRALDPTAAPARVVSTADRPLPAQPPAAPAPAKRAPMRLAVALTFVAAAATGLATSSAHERSTSTAARPAIAARTASDSARKQTLARAVERLDGRRRQHRRALARARTPAAQARAAAGLAGAYAAARADVRAATPGGVAALDPPLSRAQEAYGALAAAVRRGDAQGYRAAAAQVVVRERQAGAALRVLP